MKKVCQVVWMCVVILTTVVIAYATCSGYAGGKRNENKKTQSY